MDRAELLRWTRDPALKFNTAKTQPDFDDAVTEVTQDLHQWLATEPCNLTVGWLLEEDYRLHPGPIPRSIVPGTVLEIELGVGFQPEEALQHPCVVIRKSGSLMSIVPLTSSGNGMGYSLSAAGELSTDPADKSRPEHFFMLDFTLPGTATVSVALVDQIRTVSEARIKRLWYHNNQRIIVSKQILEALETIIASYTALSVLNGRTHWKKKYDELSRDFQKVKSDLKEVKGQLEKLRSTVKQGAEQIEAAIGMLAAADLE